MTPDQRLGVRGFEARSWQTQHSLNLAFLVPAWIDLPVYIDIKISTRDNCPGVSTMWLGVMSCDMTFWCCRPHKQNFWGKVKTSIHHLLIILLLIVLSFLFHLRCSHIYGEEGAKPWSLLINLESFHIKGWIVGNVNNDRSNNKVQCEDVVLLLWRHMVTDVTDMFNTQNSDRWSSKTRRGETCHIPIKICMGIVY